MSYTLTKPPESRKPATRSVSIRRAVADRANSQPYTIRVARTIHQVIDAWRLVYRAYVASGLIHPNPYRIHAPTQALDPHSAVLLGYDAEGAMRTTMSCMMDSPRRLPLDDVYADELDAMRQRGRRLYEVGLHALERSRHECRSHQCLFEMMRFPFYFGRYMGMTDAIIGVPPRHAPFYQRFLGFQPIGPVRTYGTVRDNPVVPLRFNLETAFGQCPMPRGVRYWQEHPAADSTFDHRFDFAPQRLAATPLARYLPRPGGAGGLRPEQAA